jgi:lysophospholipase L1-like esterase
MSHVTLARLAALLLIAPVRHTTAQPAADSGRFEAEIRQFEEHDRTAPPPAGAVLFVGSSTIRMWCTLDRDFPKRRVVNRGFGGSEMSDLLRYVGRIVVPYRPATVVLYEGDNDLAAGKTPEEVHALFARFAALVHERLPDARLVYVSVKPSVAREKLLPQTRALNAMLRGDARRDPHAAYVDVFTPMLGRDGRPRPELFGSDGLHMNSAGYAIWTAAVERTLAGGR